MAMDSIQQPSTFSPSDGAFLGWLACALTILFFVAGCARFGLGPVPLAEDEKDLVLSRYREHLQQLPLCPGIEADVNLQYRSLLKDVRISGVLLAKYPASLKFLGLSPLGQPLLLLSLHDGRFTFVDVHNKEGFTGSITASKATELLPVGKLVDEGLYALLTGGPGNSGDDPLVVGRLNNGGKGSYLLTWSGIGDDHRKQVVFDLITGEVEAFRLLDPAGKISLEIRYSQQREERCGVPAVVSISGNAVRGTLECAFEKVFAADSLSESDFQLAAPEGFTMEEVR